MCVELESVCSERKRVRVCEREKQRKFVEREREI